MYPQTPWALKAAHTLGTADFKYGKTSLLSYVIQLHTSAVMYMAICDCIWQYVTVYGNM
jgi:hypothetical protein